MITERLRHMIDEISKLPPEEQDRMAAAMQALLGQPQVSPEWRAYVRRVMEEHSETLAYLKDK